MRTSFTLLLLVACGGNNDPDDTGSTPSEEATPTADTGSVVDTAVATGACLDLWVDGEMEPDADGPDTQIHGTSAFDGDKVWVAWNRPDDGSRFDVWLARMDCSGAIDLGPFEVTDSGSLELDPVLAVSGDRVMVAWISDSQSGADNLDVRYRLYDLDGTSVTAPIDLAAERDGQVVTGNTTLPDLVATDDGFLLAGSWGHEDSVTFQAFAVGIGLDGNLQGEAADGQLDTVFGQTYVAAAVHDDDVHLLWQEDSIDSLAPAIGGGLLGDPAQRVAEPGARPDIAWGDGGWWKTWDTDNAGVIEVETPGGDRITLEDGFVHSPSLAVVDGGAVVLGMKLLGGVDNRILMWRLDDEGTVVAEHSLSTISAVSVYGVDLTQVDDDHYVVVYQDGENPAFRLKAEWITLTP